MQSKKIVAIIGMAGIFPQGKNIRTYANQPLKRHM
jgi:acyl transferase domain-containing protein